MTQGPFAITSQTPGSAPFIQDDTRRWAEAYRVNNKIKPAFVVRCASDTNFINNQFISLTSAGTGNSAYGSTSVFCKSICNVISPGQRLGGCLSWQVTETLDNIVQTAQLTILDALPVSRVSTTITGFKIGTGTAGQYTGGGSNGFTVVASMAQQWFSPIIRYQWVQNGLGISTKLIGNIAIRKFTDPTLSGNIGFNQSYREDHLSYRQFEPEVIEVANISAFPDPAVPFAENEGVNEWWNTDITGSLQGVGAYYILVGGTEVMRVTRIDRSNNRLFVIPGGRGVGGAIASHAVGETVTLLGFPPFTAQWSGFGYLMPKDYRVNQSPIRTGTSFVSYEGYGNPGDYKVSTGRGPFSVQGKSSRVAAKQFDRSNNMCFTGYWFAQSQQVTLGNDGVPQVTLTLQSPGYLLSEQKIEPNTIQRSKDIFYSWGKATFDEIGYNRTMPGDWFDFNMWDPTLPGAYPLTIATEYAQHKAFFDHMSDTDNGKTCEYCQAEWLQYILQHSKGKPTGSIAEARAVGKHIYYESIRVFNLGGQFNAGPLKTYGRLMHALAMAAWENPLEGNELGTRWTKVPNQLFDNMVNFQNGRVWNGQLAYDLDGGSTGYDWSNDTHDDKWVYGLRLPLKSPFTSQYDRQPWSQPMQDLADLNRMTYTLSREGFPVFMPLNLKLRGLPSPLLWGKPGFSAKNRTPPRNFVAKDGVTEVADTDIAQGEWHLSYGGSIDSYTHTIDPSGVLTLTYVSCQTAFGDEITFTIPAAGTGLAISAKKNEDTTQKVVQYSNQVGNKEGLQLTSGAMQTDAVSLDNTLLGLDWNTQPQSWGLTIQRGSDQRLQVDSQPPIPNPNSLLIYYESDDAKRHASLVTKLQKLVNFFIQRRYIGAPAYDQDGIINFISGFLNENGKFTGKEGRALTSAITQLQRFLAQSSAQSGLQFVGGKYKYVTPSWSVAGDSPGAWGKSTYLATKAWIHASSEFIKTDIWWYVENGLPWDQYVASIVGLNIPQIPSNSSGTDGNGTLFQIDQNALKTEAENWMKQFFKDAINYGNSVVDDSINKATQKVFNSNLADPRIQLGDVIWGNVSGYLTPVDIFGHTRAPFINGVYVTNITRSMDLQQGTYSASYSGYRYRGNFESHISQVVANYTSSHTKI